MDVHDFDLDEYVRTKKTEVGYLRDRIAKLGFEDNPSLIDHLADAFERGLRGLDRLPRSDPFWVGRNHLATESKLSDLCKINSTKLAPGVWLAWAGLALDAHRASEHLTVSALWRTSVGRSIPIEWLVEMSWIQYGDWGCELPMMPVARRLGRDRDLAARISAFASSADPSLRVWARCELAS